MKTNNKYWIYLEWLRRTGITNIYGASPYLQNEFNLDAKEAKQILVSWMQNYNPNDYEKDISIKDWEN